MKKLVLMFLGVVSILLISGCAGQTQISKQTNEKMQSLAEDFLIYNLPHPEYTTSVEFVSPIIEDQEDPAYTRNAKFVVTVTNAGGLGSAGTTTVDLIGSAINEIRKTPNIKILEDKPTTLAGNPAHKFIIESGEGQYNKFMGILMFYQNRLYSLQYEVKDVAYDKFLEESQQMIDSFKITSEGSTIAYPKTWEVKKS